MSGNLLVKKRDDQRARYNQKLSSLEQQYSFLSRELEEVYRDIEDFVDDLSRVPTRISRIRRMNYRVFTHLEKNIEVLSKRWEDESEFIKTKVRGKTADLYPELDTLRIELSQRRKDMSYEISRLNTSESKLSVLRSKISDLKLDISNDLSEFKNSLISIDRDLKIAEETVDLTSVAEFEWKEKESPIYAVEGKDLNKDIEGVITLTNLRFIFESEEEVVLKKTLFITTEKKKVRKVIFDQPIGIIKQISKGKVGFFTGHGLFIKFKRESGLPEMKLDVKGHEADQMLRLYNYVVSGSADEELESLKDEGSKKEETPRLVLCGVCGAPYTEEIYRGQTSIRCKYWDTPIAL